MRPQKLIFTDYNIFSSEHLKHVHMKIFCFCTFILASILLTSLIHAQSNPQVDSLLNVIAESEDDSLNMERYNLIRRLLIYESPEEALVYNKKHGELAQKLGLGRKYAVSKAYEATSYIPMGKYDEALTSLFIAEKYFYENDDHVPLSSVYNSIATVYEKTERDSLAKKYFQKTYELAIQNEDTHRQALALNNMSNIYFRAGNFEKSEELMKQVLAFKEVINNDYTIKYQINYANTLMKLEKYNRAEIIYKDILQNQEGLDNYIECVAYKGMGQLLMYQNKENSAIQNLQKALTMADQFNFEEERIEILNYLTKAYATTQDYRNAFQFQQAYHSALDSLNNAEKDKNLIDALTKYDTEKKQQEILLLSTQNELKDLQLQKAMQSRWGLLLGILALAIIAFFLYRLQYIKSKNNSILKEKNETISKALKEKNILLREIHHRVKNNLQVISSLLKLQSQYIQDETAITAIAEGRNRVNSMAILHQNLYQEDNLTGVDMNEYFSNLIEGLFDAYNIETDRIKLESNIHSLTLDIDTVIPLGLIANELVSNALKHAFNEVSDAKLVVHLWEEDHCLYFKVKDNGVGLNSAGEKTNQSGFGQKLIQALAEKLEAEVTSQSLNGTEIVLKIKDYKKVA